MGRSSRLVIVSLFVGTIAAALSMSGCSGKKKAASGKNAKDANKPAEKSKTPSQESKQTKVDAQPFAPDKFPRPEGVEISATVADTRTVMLRGPKNLAECQKFYETEMGKLEWKKDEAASETIDGVGYLEFTKGDLKVAITLNPTRDGKGMTIIAQGTGMSVPPEPDDE